MTLNTICDIYSSDLWAPRENFAGGMKTYSLFTDSFYSVIFSLSYNNSYISSKLNLWKVFGYMFFHKIAYHLFLYFPGRANCPSPCCPGPWALMHWPQHYQLQPLAEVC